MMLFKIFSAFYLVWCVSFGILVCIFGSIPQQRKDSAVMVFKIFSLVYLVWCVSFGIYDVAAGFWLFATVQFLFSLLAVFFFWQAWLRD